MLINSINFLLYFPIVLLVYFIIPVKIRYVWLLVVSYYFYMCWNPAYIILLLVATITTYLSGLIIEWISIKEAGTKKYINKKRVYATISIVINLGMLVFYKYTQFLMKSVSQVASILNIEFIFPEFDILFPVGISYYTFQVIGYVIDVYRGDAKAERNILRYALYVAFFPKQVSGPIERSRNLLYQLKKTTHFNVDCAKSGLLTMAYGLFLKLVVADNIASVINPVFANYTSIHGMIIMTALILFAFQIYCDFQGYTLLAIGSAKILGIDILENFNAPYLAGSVREFWQRWHISLTSWLRDYVYIPLGGNRKGIVRKQLNTIIVFALSGLWHGGGWKYIAWGSLNGLYIVLQDLVEKIRDKWCRFFRIDTESFIWKTFIRIVTFVLIDISWLFFVSNSFSEAIAMLENMMVDFNPFYIFSNELFDMFGSTRNFAVIVFSLVLVLVLDFFNYIKVDIKEKLLAQKFVVRWMIYIGLLLCILLLGNYGGGYEQTQFIYFQF